MFCKLALRNVRRSFRDYGVYLLTLTFGVCLFYTFNSLDGQSAMAMLGGVENPMVQVILTLVDIFSVFVAVVLACLILYANTFLIRRRKRELGTYLLLGLSQWQVSLLLVLETLAVGVLSLAAGLALGVLASQGLSLLTLSLFSFRVVQFQLVFSLSAMIKTIAYFSLIFLLVMALSGVQISRAKLIDLMQGQRRNEEMRPRRTSAAVVQFLLGAVCLGAAYAMLLMIGMIIVAVLPLCIVMLALGTLGTLLIFRSLSGFVLRLVQGQPGWYFKGLNLFTLRQWSSRVHSTYLSMTVICLLLLLAIGITASSMGLNNTLENLTDQQAPFDVTLQNQSGDTTLLDFPARLTQEGFDANANLTNLCDVTFYYDDAAITGLSDMSAVLPLSDYNKLLLAQGKPAYLGPLPKLPTDGVPTDNLFTGGLSLYYAVVRDEVCQQLHPRRQIFSADYVGDANDLEPSLREAVNEIQTELSVRMFTRLETYTELVGSKLLALFLGLYLGITFLLAAAAVLALQQLSQAADNAGRYAVLRRLGADRHMLAQSASHQVALAFLLPLGLAVVHSIVGMKAANDIISVYGQVDSVQSSLITAGVLLVIYGGYFLATSLACRRMAKQS